MIKRIIAPIQDWLLKRHQCVGCGRPLEQGKIEQKNGVKKVTCACGRIFIEEGGNYRRALFSEV